MKLLCTRLDLRVELPTDPAYERTIAPEYRGETKAHTGETKAHKGETEAQ